MDRLIEQVRAVLARAEDHTQPAAELPVPICAASQRPSPAASVARAPVLRRMHSDTLPMSPAALRGLSDWHDACDLSELPEGSMRGITLDGRELLLARRGSTIVCFTNACAGVGCAAGNVSTCPQHGLQYHLAANGYLLEPAAALLIHPARILGTRVEVRLR